MKVRSLVPFHYLLGRPLLLVIPDVREVRLPVDALEVAVSAREHSRRPVSRPRLQCGGLGRVAACHVVLERRCLQGDRANVGSWNRLTDMTGVSNAVIGLFEEMK